MYQTMTPFVEMYIHGKDILRSPDGKPKTLISFSYTIVSQSEGGSFNLEVFDPDYVAIEELMLTTGDTGINVSEEVYGADESTTAPMSSLVPVYFRFGYLSRDGGAFSHSGNKYLVGNIGTYTPTMLTNGVQLSITGYVTGAYPILHFKKRVLPRTYNLGVYDTIKKVCTHMGWDFKSINDGGQELPNEQQHEDLFDCDQSLTSTEEQHRGFKMEADETALKFIERISHDTRPRSNRYGLYTFYMTYLTGQKPSPGNYAPGKGTLVYGPEQMDKQPVRRYVFLRDPTTDVLTFSPTVNGMPSQIIGKNGFVVNTEDTETGESRVILRNEANRYLHYYTEGRSELFVPRPQDGREFIMRPGMGLEKNVEGMNSGPSILYPDQEYSSDDSVMLEVSSRATKKMASDRQSMNQFMAAQTLTTSATLEIFGDPSEELLPNSRVVVFVLVPAGGSNRFRMHYTSDVYNIQGVTHQISDGTYITTLELYKASFGDAGTTSKALYTELSNIMGPNASLVY